MAVSELDMALHRSVMERRAPIEERMAEEDAKKRAKWYEDRESLGGAQLTKEKIKKILRSDRRLYYVTAELNEKLYLHFGGYSRIENLEPFVNLRTLYLESNAIEKIDGLEKCTQLRSLFLQENCIKKLSGIDHLKELKTLNVCNNFIYKIEGLPEGLETLQIANNQLGHSGLDDVRELAESKIHVLDLQGNKIQEAALIEDVIAKMPELKVLYLKGNQMVSAIKSYRKRVITALPVLTYLDDRPVFKDERRFSEAFVRGGLEAEREERKKHKEEERDAHKRQMEGFKRMCDEAKRAGRERRAMMANDKYTEDTDPVDTWERRCKRAIMGWEEENKELLKDDAKESALKVLKTEKEQGVGMYDPELQKAYANADVSKATSGRTVEEEAAMIPSRWSQEHAKKANKKPGSNKRPGYGDVWDDEAIVFDDPNGADKDPKMTLSEEEKKAVSEILQNMAGDPGGVSNGGSRGSTAGNSGRTASITRGATRIAIEEETESTAAGSGGTDSESMAEPEDRKEEKPAFSFNPRGRAAKPAQDNELDELD